MGRRIRIVLGGWRRGGAGLLAAAVVAALGLVAGPVAPASAAETTVTTPGELADAFNAAAGDDNVVSVGADFTVGTGTTIVVPADATVTLDLHGHQLKVTGSKWHAGVGVSGSAGLVVEDSAGGGALTATGGMSGAGIGGGDGEAGGTITINGGEVHASGSAGSPSYGAGIGGGQAGAGGTIVINGGKVHATGGDFGAGIGGGLRAAGGTVTITGGEVHATGGQQSGAGIGSGDQATGAAGTIRIQGGTVTAHGRWAAGIGGGWQSPGGDVEIGVSAVVTASSDTGSAVGAGHGGTGFGSLSNAGTLTIPSGRTLMVPSDATVTNTGTIVNEGALAGQAEQGAGTIENPGVIVNTGTVKPSLTVTKNNYLLTFDTNGGSDQADVRVYAQTLDAAQMALPPEPTRTGYGFTGWYLNDDLSGDPLTTSTVLGEGGGPSDVPLYAGWDANSYTVSFDSGGGSNVADQMVDYGSTVDEPAAPTREGYSFDGWYTAADGGKVWGFATPVTADATVYAQWTRLVTSFTLQASPTSLQPGDDLTVTGTGLPEGSTVEVVLHSQPVALGTAIAAADGTFATTTSVPADTAAGDHAVVATATLPDGATVTEQVMVTVSAPQQQPTPEQVLPSTGGLPLGLVGVAAGLVLAGSGLAGGTALWRRNRRTSS